MTNIYDEVKKIVSNAKKVKTYDTGLAHEQIIIASYQRMSIEQLEKMRYIINKIIKAKKEKLYQIKSNNNSNISS
jgi:hypothetical protein